MDEETLRALDSQAEEEAMLDALSSRERAEVMAWVWTLQRGEAHG
jgi:hypothetical protein